MNQPRKNGCNCPATLLTLAIPLPSRLRTREIGMLALSTLGGALELYDFVVFVFLAGALSEHFFPSTMPAWLRHAQTLGIFAAGYLARPVGGLIVAHFGDLLGRKRMFMLSVSLMAGPTLAIGVMPTYAAIGVMAPLLLLAMRLLQGAAVGGEIPGAWVFVAEHLPEDRIGLACGVLMSGLMSGFLLSSAIVAALGATLGDAAMLAYGWRIPFVIGGIFGLVLAYLRRWLQETPVFCRMRDDCALASEAPLRALLRAQRATVLRCMALTWSISACVLVIVLMTPTLLIRRFGFTDAQALYISTTMLVALVVGSVIFGCLIDRYGARRTVCLGLGAVALSYATLMETAAQGGSMDTLLALSACVGLLVGVAGAIPTILVAAFPAEVRFTGLSFCYNVAYAISGSATPLLIACVTPLTPHAPMLYVTLVCAIVIIVQCCHVESQQRPPREADEPQRPRRVSNGLNARPEESRASE